MNLFTVVLGKHGDASVNSAVSITSVLCYIQEAEKYIDGRLNLLLIMAKDNEV